MIKKLLIANIIVMLTLGFNVIPAQAYTRIGSPVRITAEGEIAGIVGTFSAQAVNQGTGTGPSARITFSNPSGPTVDSGRALKITGKTNRVDARIVIYTDNDNNTYVPAGGGNPVANPPDIDPATGVDGSGMVGQDVNGYIAPLFWGINSAAHYDPNTNVNYVFDQDRNDEVGDVWIVDKRHTHSFTTVGSALDNGTLYRTDGSVYSQNINGDGLYDQLWDVNLWNHPTNRDEDVNLVSPALYRSIATVGFLIGEGTDDRPDGQDDSGYYVCYVPDLTTTDTDDSAKARLMKKVGTPHDHLYVYIGADFGGRPAQKYSTNRLTVEMVYN